MTHSQARTRRLPLHLADRGTIGALTLVLALAAATPAVAEDGRHAINGSPTVAVAPVVSADASSVVVTGRPTCITGKVVMRPDGALGYAVPVVGPTVLRGSADLGPSTMVDVVPLYRRGANGGNGGNTVTICAGMP